MSLSRLRGLDSNKQEALEQFNALTDGTSLDSLEPDLLQDQVILQRNNEESKNVVIGFLRVKIGSPVTIFKNKNKIPTYTSPITGITKTGTNRCQITTHSGSVYTLTII